MSLRAVSVVELREQVLREAAAGRESVQEVCRRWGIGTSTFYRWKARFDARGADGLEDLPRRPFRSPGQIPYELEDAICRMRKDNPRWGARRIRAEFIRAESSPPAVSTIHQVLVRNHLVALRPGRRPKATRRFAREIPNDLWQMDATRVKLASGAWCWVIDVLDDHARFLLAAVACRQPTTALAWEAFSRAAGRYGLPRQVLTDNDLIFSGRLHGGQEVGFERQLRAAGVQLIHSRPYHPETQGKLERFHRTLKELLADLGPPRDLAHLGELLEAISTHYNHERPHQALGEATTPAERYLPSPAALVTAEAETEPDYPAGAVVRSVGRNGVLTYDTAKWSVGTRWAGQRLRVIARGDRVDFFRGSELVRSATREPSRSYYPLPARRYPGKEGAPLGRAP